MVKKRNHPDPYYQRELKKYEHPIASREYILQCLTEIGTPVSERALLKVLKIKKESQKEALSFRLKAMLRDGQLMQDRRGRYCLFDKINLKHGVVSALYDGSGLFTPSDQSEVMVLSPKSMKTVMHGDTVLAYPLRLDRKGRLEGKIHEVLIHAHQHVVGTLSSEQSMFFVTPHAKQLTQNIFIPVDKINQAKPGQIVLVQITTYPQAHMPPMGEIAYIVGDHMAPGLEIDVAILAHKLPHTWSDEVLAEAQLTPLHVTAAACADREDLRHIPFVTIDGEDAKDFDDAVYAEMQPQGGFKLYVAIADVSHYVSMDSCIDQEACLRGNSVYFPGQVIPMLPEVLSNGICSLNPLVDRLCVIMEMHFSQEGEMTWFRPYRAVIHSHARLTYTVVDTWLTQTAAIPEALYTIAPSIHALDRLYTLLQARREVRGALYFDSVEARIVFNEQRKIETIVPVVRNTAHHLIEECMLAANVAAAQYLAASDLPVLYRVHAAPEPEKLAALREFLGGFGLILQGGETPSPKDFKIVLDKIAHRPDKHLIETVLLRSLKQAHYAISNEGHFGLAYAAYAHFTSPIRRYPDLLIHRAIVHRIDQHRVDDFAYTPEKMNTLGQHCSMTERRADDATREVVAWLKCEYMQSRLGQIFTGRISSVTSFGVFVELDDIFIEGLVHITALKNDYYHYHPVQHCLIGERSHVRYQLGDMLRVQVARVQLEERKIDFEPVWDEEVDV